MDHRNISADLLKGALGEVLPFPMKMEQEEITESEIEEIEQAKEEQKKREQEWRESQKQNSMRKEQHSEPSQ